jgi:tellurite resistance protein TerC
MHSVGTWWMWLGFFVFVLFVIVIDMVVLGNKKTQKIGVRQALTWTTVWISCALLFCVVLWWHLTGEQGAVIAKQRAFEFLTGYIIELSLSVDNLFVFIMIFNHFAVPEIYQRRVLLYGVLGAMLMRLIMIVAGTWIVSEFHWVLYLFGLFLVYTGIKMLFTHEAEKDLSKNKLLNYLRSHMRITHEYHGDHFFVRKDLLLYATPLFLVLLMIEFSDLVFALDSIPAIFSVTSDPFIIFTSNIFAIMGLRALYFLLAYMASRFYLLKYGIAVVLTFVGAKMLMAPWIHVPIGVALSLVIAILSTSVILSSLAPPKE